jgi:hypothetical protein
LNAIDEGEEDTPMDGGGTMMDLYDTQKIKLLAISWNLHGKLPKDSE